MSTTVADLINQDLPRRWVGEVCDCLEHQVWSITEGSQSSVAVTTEESSNFIGGMVMIDVETLDLGTDGALSILEIIQRLVIDGTESQLTTSVQGPGSSQSIAMLLASLFGPGIHLESLVPGGSPTSGFTDLLSGLLRVCLTFHGGGTPLGGGAHPGDYFLSCLVLASIPRDVSLVGLTQSSLVLLSELTGHGMPPVNAQPHVPAHILSARSVA